MRDMTKEELGNMISALKLAKKNFLARDQLDLPHKEQWICRALWEVRKKATDPTMVAATMHAKWQIEEALDGELFLTDWINENNEHLFRDRHADDAPIRTQQRWRHRWVNQLIRDYTAMHKAMKS